MTFSLKAHCTGREGVVGKGFCHSLAKVKPVCAGHVNVHLDD